MLVCCTALAAPVLDGPVPEPIEPDFRRSPLALKHPDWIGCTYDNQWRWKQRDLLGFYSARIVAE